MVMTRKGTFYIFWTETSQFTIDFTFFTSYIFYRGWCKHNLINVVIEISINPRNDNLIICQYRGRFCPVVLFPLYVFFVFFCIFFFLLFIPSFIFSKENEEFSKNRNTLFSDKQDSTYQIVRVYFWSSNLLPQIVFCQN